jgi:hypothetical protein
MKCPICNRQVIVKRNKIVEHYRHREDDKISQPITCPASGKRPQELGKGNTREK